MPIEVGIVLIEYDHRGLHHVRQFLWTASEYCLWKVTELVYDRNFCNVITFVVQAIIYCCLVVLCQKILYYKVTNPAYFYLTLFMSITVWCRTWVH